MLNPFKKELILIVYLIIISVYFLYAFYPGNHITIFWQTYYHITVCLFIIYLLLEAKKRYYYSLLKKLMNVAIFVNLFTILFFLVKLMIPKTVEYWKKVGYINNAILILIILGLFYIVVKHLKIRQ